MRRACGTATRFRLRAFEPGDWETYFAWDQDSEQARSLYAIPFPRSREATKRWAEEEAIRQPSGDDRRFVIESDAGEVVGNLTTHECDRRAGTFAYGISVRADRRGRGYAAEAITLLLRSYFEELRYQKVTVGVYVFNLASIRWHEKLRFQREGRLGRTVYTRGEYFDELVFGLTAEEFAARHPRPDRGDGREEPRGERPGRLHPRIKPPVAPSAYNDVSTTLIVDRLLLAEPTADGRWLIADR